MKYLPKILLRGILDENSQQPKGYEKCHFDSKGAEFWQRGENSPQTLGLLD
ncbi:MAG: hypothetical protein ABIR13_02565 [Polaromonas sp.]